MSNVKCETVREWIPDYVGGRLARLDDTSVRSHLKACDDCSAELELARLIFAPRPDLPDAPANPLPSPLVCRVQNRWGVA